MISIIAGKYKGHKLNHLKDLKVRPTQAKVRKSIFQILEPFDGLKILDLYAGVGTLGIESISRGACEVVFVEDNRKVFGVLKKNLKLINFSNYEIFLMDALKFIERTKCPCYDIVFADPPYSAVQYEFMKNKIERILKPGGIFCMEMNKEPIDSSEVRIKYYGSTQVVFWESVA